MESEEDITQSALIPKTLHKVMIFQEHTEQLISPRFIGFKHQMIRSFWNTHLKPSGSFERPGKANQNPRKASDDKGVPRKPRGPNEGVTIIYHCTTHTDKPSTVTQTHTLDLTITPILKYRFHLKRRPYFTASPASKHYSIIIRYNALTNAAFQRSPSRINCHFMQIAFLSSVFLMLQGGIIISCFYVSRFQPSPGLLTNRCIH